MPPKIVLQDPVLGPLTDDLLTRDVRVFQRAKGHRFSSDDVATAYVAHRARPDARRVLDLGTGLGSVLLLLAWKLGEAELCGVEAQAMSFELLTRNVARSGFQDRVRVRHGDLRDPGLLAGFERQFDLITGTPPYFPPQAALEAEDEQRAYARIEYRGGVEAYIEAGAPLLAPGAALVLCGDARAEERVVKASRAASLALVGRAAVVARAGELPLFSIWTLSHTARPFVAETLTLRGPSGERTPDAQSLREFSGFGH
ncbi:MAG: methyltransferase domain-containing protein [Myxococcales bacterium]|nr:MAG: methyltransferase domain-containing protein [Myxococcales bacterium]